MPAAAALHHTACLPPPPACPCRCWPPAGRSCGWCGAWTLLASRCWARWSTPPSTPSQWWLLGGGGCWGVVVLKPLPAGCSLFCRWWRVRCATGPLAPLLHRSPTHPQASPLPLTPASHPSHPAILPQEPALAHVLLLQRRQGCCAGAHAAVCHRAGRRHLGLPRVSGHPGLPRGSPRPPAANARPPAAADRRRRRRLARAGGGAGAQRAARGLEARRF